MSTFLRVNEVGKLASQYGMILFANDIPKFDPARFPGAAEGLVGQQRLDFIHYLRLLGAKPKLLDINPTLDGVNHINIYSHGKTEAGRMASNFYSDGQPFITPDGGFFSLEGYYHWLRIRDWLLSEKPGSSMDDLERENRELRGLRRANGSEAIADGRKLKREYYGGTGYVAGEMSPEARRDFQCAIAGKLHRLQVGTASLGNYLSSIVYHGVPLTHYYVYDSKMNTPKFSEFLPNLIRELAVNIDPTETTFDLDSLYDVIRNQG